MTNLIPQHQAAQSDSNEQQQHGQQPQSTTINLPRGELELTYQTNSDYQLEDLLGFAQRINPKRAFLFVSKVLGRHIPVAPSQMRHAFTKLANLVPDNLPEPIVVIGMAETAVGLSAGVHQALQTRYPKALLLNSTRHTQQDATLLTTFSEDHSHASKHLIYQSKDADIQNLLLSSKTLIMVDDEASTGNTCVNVVSALRDAGLKNLQQVHLTTLVDWSLNPLAQALDSEVQDIESSNIEMGKVQTTSDESKVTHQDDRIATRLPGIKFQRHHLLAGAWQWTDAPNPEPISMPSVDTTEAGSQPILPTGNWGRQPTHDSTEGFDDYLAQFKKIYAQQFAVQLTPNSDQLTERLKPFPQKILVLGSNEFVWLPFLLAEWLESEIKAEISPADTMTGAQNNQYSVKFSALTRSPIALGGAIEARMGFNDNYGLGMTNFAYNVKPADWDLIVLCVETPHSSVDEVWSGLDNVLVVSPK